MNTLTKCLISGLAGVLLAVIVGVTNFDCGGKTRLPETVTIHDTTTLERYNLRIDTMQNNVIRNIISHQSEPTIIYQEKISWKEIEKFKDYDLMLGFEKKNNTLRVFAVNQNDSLIKEEVFNNVFDNFEAWSANDRIVVKSNKFSWNGLNLGVEHSRPVTDLKTSFQNKIDLTTGLKYKDRYSFDAGAEYNVEQKDIKLKAKITVRLF